MVYLILVIAVIVLIGFIYQEYKTLSPLFASKSSAKVQNAELVKTLLNLDEKQARRVTEKAADEVVRLAVEKRKAEYRNSAAQEEMRNLINNANLLDQRVGDYKITSTFETASGTTNVEIHKSKSTSIAVISTAVGVIVVILILVFLVVRN